MSSDPPVSEPADAGRTDAAGAPAVRRVAPAPLSITSEKLFAGATEVQISHGGAVYRLKQTALGKLILTK